MFVYKESRRNCFPISTNTSHFLATFIWRSHNTFFILVPISTAIPHTDKLERLTLTVTQGQEKETELGVHQYSCINSLRCLCTPLTPGQSHSDQPAQPGDILGASAGAMKGTGISGQGWKWDMAGLLFLQETVF